MKPTSPALAGGFLTTRPQGSPIMQEVCAFSTCRKEKKESEVAQPYLTLCDPMDCSLLGSSVHGIFQAKSTGVGCHLIRVVKSCLPFPGTGVGDIFTNGNFLYKYMFPFKRKTLLLGLFLCLLFLSYLQLKVILILKRYFIGAYSSLLQVNWIFNCLTLAFFSY